jgi:hypothetical protein
MRNDEMNKWCPGCQQYLARNLFYRNAAQFDGLAPYCKKCWSEICSKRHARLREGLPDKRRAQMDLVHHDYFKCIERPIQAYVLGLLASDGNVASDRPRIQFSVHEEDRILTEIVRDELAPGSPILMQKSRDRDYEMAKVHFTSPRMYRDLAKLGIIPRKSHTLSWPEMLPRDFINSYLLGVFDGDGWITIDKRKPILYHTLGIISASPTFLERAAQEIAATIDVPLARLSAVNQRAFTIRYGGKSAILMSEWLHRDLPGLARKRIHNI